MARCSAVLLVVAWSTTVWADGDEPVVDPAGTDPLGIDPDAELVAPPPPAIESLRRGPLPPPSARSPLPALAPGIVDRASVRSEVAFQDGLAIVDVRATFRGTTDMPARVDERLPIPRGAVPVAIEACLGVAATDPAICRPGTLGAGVARRDDDPHVPRASVVIDDGGRTLHVTAWPATLARALRVRVRVVVEAPVHGGTARLRWPTPPLTLGSARPTVRIVPGGFGEPRVAGRDASHGPVPVDASSEVDVSVAVPPVPEPVASVLRGACGAPCARVRLEAPPRPAAGPVDLVVLLDRSASMQSVPPERVRSVVDALQRLLPAGSLVRLVAFAAHAAEVPAPGIATAQHLGSSTRFDAAFALAAELLAAPRARPLVVVVGDGGITDVDASREAFAAAARQGIEVDAISLGDDPAAPALHAGVRQAGGVVVELRDADEGRALEQRLAAILAPTAVPDVRVRLGRDEVDLGPLRAGEELGWIGHLPAGAPLEVRGAPALPGIDPSGDTSRFVAARLTPARAASGTARAFPARDVLAILRARLLPGARGCLRRDRAGRPGHAVRAVFELAFADREVADVDVTGAISPTLRRCLLEATETLEVPPFPGRVLVRYPVATRAEPLAAPLPLPADLDAQVQSVLE